MRLKMDPRMQMPCFFHKKICSYIYCIHHHHSGYWCHHHRVCDTENLPEGEAVAVLLTKEDGSKDAPGVTELNSEQLAEFEAQGADAWHIIIHHHYHHG